MEALARRYMTEPVGERSEAQGAAREHTSRSQDGEASCSHDAAALEDHPGYVLHEVQKSDTLAGLAIRYNIAVGDIKRANGLMSEGMMWIRCGPCRARLPRSLVAVHGVQSACTQIL